MRKTRANNGWDSIINAYMNKLPSSWPYTSKVTDPRIRTSLLEKTARLLNSKLRGRLVPREGGDIIKARINNAVLDYQWDRADNSGSMIEKVAKADLYARTFGASFVLNYWDNDKNCNEMKLLDPRDVFPDYTADHVKNAKWCQVREFSTLDELEANGYQVKGLRDKLKGKHKVDRSQLSIVKQNRGLEERLGQDDDNPKVEVVTEWTAKKSKEPAMRYVFLPRFNELLSEGKSPYKHQIIPVNMLRYYPLQDDIYGESEIEPVISLSRAINAILCGFIDTMNLATRPPVKIIAGESRQETIVFNPAARWIVNNINSGTEVQIGDAAIKAFNNTYPALVAAYNTAMGEQSLGISNVRGYQTDKTATEIMSLERQQTSRDQYNQLYLSQFLKDIMMMWLSNNQQYLFDDPTKAFEIVRIVGKSDIQELEQLGLGETVMEGETVNELGDMVITNAGKVSAEELENLMGGTRVPKHPVIKNPEAKPIDYEVVKKLETKEAGNEAELYITKEDMDGTYDYIPDVKAMALGASRILQEGRKQAFEMAVNPTVMGALAQEGQRLKMSELLSTILEDAGVNDADNLFEAIRETDLPLQSEGNVSSSGQIAPGTDIPNIQAGVESSLAQGQNMV